MWHLSYVFSKTEKRILIVSFVFLFLSLVGIFYHFYKEEGKFLIAATEGQVYSEIFFDELNILNPLFATKDSPEEDISSFLFSGLLKRDRSSSNFVPDLAFTYAINSLGDEYTFVIKDNVFWHDGVLFNIDDVIFTIDLLKNHDFVTSYGNLFDDVTVTKEQNSILKIKLKKPDYYFIRNFTFPVLPKHLLGNLESEKLISSGFNFNPIGTGLFKFQSLERSGESTYITLISHPNFYGDKAKIKKLIFQFTTDKDEYLKGYNRFKGLMVSKKVESLDLNSFTNPKFEASQYQIMFFNTESVFLKNRGVRQAIYLSLDFADKVKQMNYNPIFRRLMYQDQEIKDESDPKEVLYNNGWQIYSQEFKDSFRRNIQREKMSLKLITLNNPYYLQVAEEIKRNLATLGIELVYAGFNQNELEQDLLLQKNYDILLLGVKVDNLHDLFPFLHSSQAKNVTGLNFSKYSNLEVDLLLEDMRTVTEPGKRLRVVEELEKRLFMDIPFVFVSSGYLDFYLNKSIKDVSPPSKVHSYKDRFITFAEWYIDGSQLKR